MDFHSINIKTGEISEEVILTIDDERLKEIGMKVNGQGKDEKSK